MVAIFPGQQAQVDCRAQRTGKCEHEFLHQLGIEIAHFLRGDGQIPAQRGAAGNVHRGEHQRLVHGQNHAAIAPDAAPLAQRLIERAPQRDANVFRGVVEIHIGIAFAGEFQIEIPVPGEQLQHVVQKAAAGLHRVFPLAIQFQGERDARFRRVTLNCCLSHAQPPAKSRPWRGSALPCPRACRC